MATSPTATGGRIQAIRRRAALPPRRGQIKARIFVGLVKTASLAANRAGELLGVSHGIKHLQLRRRTAPMIPAGIEELSV